MYSICISPSWINICLALHFFCVCFVRISVYPLSCSLIRFFDPNRCCQMNSIPFVIIMKSIFIKWQRLFTLLTFIWWYHVTLLKAFVPFLSFVLHKVQIGLCVCVVWANVWHVVRMISFYKIRTHFVIVTCTTENAQAKRREKKNKCNSIFHCKRDTKIQNAFKTSPQRRHIAINLCES